MLDNVQVRIFWNVFCVIGGGGYVVCVCACVFLHALMFGFSLVKPRLYTVGVPSCFPVVLPTMQQCVECVFVLCNVR